MFTTLLLFTKIGPEYARNSDLVLSPALKAQDTHSAQALHRAPIFDEIINLRKICEIPKATYKIAWMWLVKFRGSDCFSRSNELHQFLIFAKRHTGSSYFTIDSSNI